MNKPLPETLYDRFFPHLIALTLATEAQIGKFGGVKLKELSGIVEPSM